MKILVTGGAGFIGSNLVRYLLRETTHQVINLDKLTYAGNLHSLRDVADHPHYHFVHADIVDPIAVQKVFQEYQPHAVMHLAAESHVDRSIDGPGQFIQTNVVGTYQLLSSALQYWRELPDGTNGKVASADAPSLHPPSPICPKNAFRFLHVSTDEVYGSLGPLDPAFTESSPYAPHSPYSASKASSDHLARAWFDTYKLPVLVTNCSNNYGPYQFPEKLIPVVILKCLRGDRIPVYGKGENIRDWLYVEDHCRALVTVLERGTPGETYNIGGRNERKNLDLVKDICVLIDELAPDPHILRHECLIEFVKDRPGHDLRYAIDTSKIEHELGWQPRENATTGLRKTVQWYLHNRAWWESILSGEYRMERLGVGGGVGWLRS